MTIAAPFGRFVLSLRRRAGAHHGVRLVAICLGFAALLAAGLHSGRDLASMLSATFAKPSHVGADAQGRGAPGVAAAADNGFSGTRVGQLLFSSYRSDVCRRVLFDNRTGFSYEAGRIECGVLAEAAADPAHDRAEALRRAFRK